VYCLGRIATLAWAFVVSITAGELRNLVGDGLLGELRWPEFSAYRAHVERFYNASNYTLAWTRNGQATAQAQAMIQALKSADTNGLDPEDYDGSRWPLRLSTLRQPGISERDLGRFDLALTISVMRYVSDLHTGRVNPKLFHIGFDVAHQSYDLADLVRARLIDAKDIQTVLESIDPPFEGYRRTQKALERYIDLSQKSDDKPLPPLGKPLDPGGFYAGIPKLTRLLYLFGDLPANSPPPAKSAYEGQLVEAVKRFQIRHGLDPDGRIGASTLRQLNTPLARRVRQLKLTLERWRWVPHEFSRPPIVVNIPEFKLRALDQSYVTGLDMKVVVGKAYRHRTPVFAGELKYVIFRPYWNVPLSIVRAEVLPVIARSRSLEGAYGDFQIITHEGAVVTERPLSNRTLSQLRSGKLWIRQLPGPKNALGLVKFIFPNDNSVYLHDTPSQQLFSKPRRDFSHGCIRLEKPQALAEWVLRSNPDWPPDRIAEAMNGDATVQANVNPAIPVLIVYATAVALQGGEVRFFDDIYGYDALLEAQLDRDHP
jgi:murein L,D-transpeptidase YcbB/YkuD